MRNPTAAAIAIVLGSFLFESAADARVGGGHSFSGGGGHGSGNGSSGGGGGELIYLLLQLIIHVPHIGVPVAVLAVIAFIWFHHKKKQMTDWDSGPSVHLAPTAELEQIHDVDPEFSTVLFEDFIYRLYAQTHQARGTPHGLDALSPYLSEEVRQELQTRPPTGLVTNVLIGAMRTTRLQIPEVLETPDGHADYIYVDIEFESNLTIRGQESFQTYYVVERWSLARAATATTKPPEHTKNFPCPNCGAAFQSVDNQRCEYCDEVVNNGRFDWLVINTIQSHITDRAPTLTATVTERGTDLPTYFHHSINNQWMTLTQEDPGTTEESLGARVQLLYAQLNESWSQLDLSTARPYVSDGMFDYLQYWVTAYKQQRLRNVLEEMHITRWAFAKLIRDKHFDALTIRLWATGRDYTIATDTAKVVSGSKRTNRDYSEYWTLIRSAKAQGASTTSKNCPSCGAPMKISMAGNCEYCGSHITSGEFDWILSKIEQDDTYRG